MKYTNFEHKYVQPIFGSDTYISLWKHKTGVVCDIDMYWESNEVYISFENGITLTIAIKGSVIKVGFHDDFRTRDLSTHPGWNADRGLLIKLYLRQILKLRTTYEEREAIWDIVSNEFTF
ncbi:hypothetical protein fHeYen901_228 [Yersinia phage fHe-Yen9-01]|uniref:Phage protein n=1 Tax=Yersinia phage fHe-Yen9-01 TaxID=1965363 RepID=A0A1V0DXX4_9CAUD|nr:hypothetical protein KNT60_gp227 [Yersinia phage fHe-Yen9-01]ARB06001.1 hypothetical protein fHeYen901_228 [Yersinia phage fHe-Yen9-01]